MPDYYPPKFNDAKFHCALCGVFAAQRWARLEYEGTTQKSAFSYSRCEHCSKLCYWHEDQMIVPTHAPVPIPHQDMPERCLPDYNEARSIVSQSPKAAAALMRLCVQRLMVELGQTGNNINDDIGTLVSSGLPPEVQQALDFCRVVGNNAVHPGEIVLDDSPDIAYSLFEMVNFVVEDRISRPKRIAALYSSLPAGARAAIQKRDGESTAGA